MKNQQLQAMEEDFARLIETKGKDKQAAERIQRTVNRLFKIDATVEVVENKHQEFFGMAVYPDKSLVDLIISELVHEGPKENRFSTIEKLWGSNSIWHVEIDELILTDRNLNVNPAEMVAILLHELGHVAFSNTTVTRITRVVNYRVVKLNHKVRSILKWPRARKLLDLVVVEACNVKNFVTDPLKEERYADQYAYDFGYGEQLQAFIQKLLEVQGNKSINRTEKEMDQDVDTMVQWTLENVAELEFRKNKLKKLLETEVRRTPSKYVHDILTTIKNSFFANDEKELYLGAVKEAQVMKEYEGFRNVKESYNDLTDEFGRIKRLKQIDIDMLQMSLNKIKTLDDKLYLLDQIKEKLDILDASQDMYDMNEGKRVLIPQTYIDGFRKQLENLRESTMKTKVNTYRGFYRFYPAGYEG